MADEDVTSRQIPWGRFFVEGVLIVASILLAFTIDAMWEERQLRAEEQRVLRSLKEDFAASREELTAVTEGLVRSQDRFARFQASTPAEVAQWPADSVRLNMLHPSRTFDPFTGTLDGLVGAGKLDLLRDVRLRTIVGAWLKGVADLPENASEVRAEAVRVNHALEALGGPFFTYMGDAAPRLSVLPQPSAAIPSAVRGSAAVMGAARSHHWALSWYLAELERLGPVLDSTLVLIDANIRY